MEVIDLKLDKIKPYEKNAKTHPEEQVQLIANSIKEFGFRTPIVVDEEFVIIQGHGRRLASLSLGLNTVPCVIADNLSKEQVKMLRLADNKVAESEWDVPLLDMELLDLNEFFELEDFGFDFDEPNDLNEDEADTVPELEENPCIKLGDLIELGNHRLLCGSATEEVDVEKLMNGDKFALAITDPPYNVAVNDESEESLKKRNRRSDGLTIKNDKMSDDDFNVFLKSSFDMYFKYAEDGGAIYVFYADSMTIPFMSSFIDSGFHFAQNCIWNKQQFVMTRKDYHYKHEPIMYGWKKGKAHSWHTDRKQSSVWNFDRPFVNELHPTMKPIDLLEYPLGNSSSIGSIVCDLFGGSGSTMIACENLNRKARLMELDEKYAQVIIQRYCDYTGNDTIKINGNEVSWAEYKERAENSR